MATVPSAADEHRKRLAAQRAGEIKTRRYKPPAVQPKGNPAFARKDKGRVPRV